MITVKEHNCRHLHQIRKKNQNNSFEEGEKKSNQLKTSRRKEIIKSRIEINAIINRKTIKRINEIKSRFLWKKIKSTNL